MTTETPLEPTPTPVLRPPRRRSTALTVSIVTIVVGAFLLVGTLGGAAGTAIASLSGTDHGASGGAVSTHGLTDIDIEVAGGALTIAYDDVPEARLDADGPAGWTFERRGSSLRVSSPDRMFADWRAGRAATLTLPRALANSAVNADIEVTGGSLDLDGTFGAMKVQLAGGQVSLAGAARSLDVTVSGGSASAEVADVDTAAFEVAGGQLSADLSGRTPSRTRVTVNAGSADITLPDDQYRVKREGGVGRIDNTLRQSSSATAVVEIEAALGSVSLSS